VNSKTGWVLFTEFKSLKNHKKKQKNTIKTRANSKRSGEDFFFQIGNVSFVKI
jgi:hypothetical protein